jgi:hypothetical protein
MGNTLEAISSGLRAAETSDKPFPDTVGIATLDNFVIRDLINNGKIQSETEQLRISMNCSAQIVVAAYQVADYVPNLQNAQHQEFWEKKVRLSRRFSIKNEALNV